MPCPIVRPIIFDMKHITKAYRLIALTLVVIVVSLMPEVSTAAEFSNESLDYKVMYKWGLVNKQAGHATLSVRRKGAYYITQLTAASERWADRFYKVRDTLKGSIEIREFKPQFYEKIAHEGDDHKHDMVRYTHHGAAKVSAKCTRTKRDKKGRLTVNQSINLEATGTTLDMLSAFYYMRTLPFESWQAGHVVTVNVFSGKRKELLTIKYIGKDNVRYDKRNYSAYHIRFTFNGNGGKKTSDDMDAWITADSRRIPVKLEGKLKVGKVQCFYTGK